MATRKRRESFGAIRKLPSGRQQASYVAPDGERHTAPRTFDTVTDARAWLAAQRVRVDSGTWVPPQRQKAAEKAVTFAVYAAEWIGTRTGRDGAPLRDRTRLEYERLLRGPLAPLSEEPIATMKSAQVRAWYSALSSSGTLTTAARAYGLLRSVLATAVEDGVLSSNPATIRGAQNATSGKKVEPPTSEELATILEHLPERHRPLVLIAAWGGLRYGELTELRRRDIILTDATVTVIVERAVVHVTGEGYKVGPPKSKAGVRTVVLPSFIRPEVLEHLNTRVGPSPDALLFPATGSATHMAQSTFAKSWMPARAAAGRDDLPVHALRHFAGTKYAQTGATLREIQGRLGHSSVAAAMRYQHAAGRDAELADRMVR